MKGERKDFKKWQVEIAYEVQDGQCLKCGNPLAAGFHRHHKDDNPANVRSDNLELLCMECHIAKKGADSLEAKAFIEHAKIEKKALERVDELLEKAFEGKLAGTVIERITDAITLQLRISRRLNKIDAVIERPPASIMMAKELQKSKMLGDTYFQGLREGIKIGARAIESQIDDATASKES